MSLHDGLKQIDTRLFAAVFDDEFNLALNQLPTLDLVSDRNLNTICKPLARLAFIPSKLASGGTLVSSLSSISMREGVNALAFTLTNPLTASPNLVRGLRKIHTPIFNPIFEETAREVFDDCQDGTSGVTPSLEYPSLLYASEQAQLCAAEQPDDDDRTLAAAIGVTSLGVSIQRYIELM